MTDWSGMHLLGATSVEIEEIRQAAPHGKWAFTLTFDDGPEEKEHRTERILETLESEKLQAAFFLIGSQVDGNPGAVNLVKKIFSAGHYIGSHSYNHTRHTKLSNSEITENIKKSKAVLQPYVYDLFRLPFGDGFYVPDGLNVSELNHYLSKKKFIFDLLKAEGFRHLLWNCDPQDWNVIRLFGEDVFQDNELNHLARKMVILKILNDLNTWRQNAGIIVFHDVHEHTVRNLRYYIQVLKGLGHSVVSLDQLNPVPPRLLL
jgi:peptidoglycan/xylan/chitin deacetylase (PgdA/CDA1 family)